MRRIATATDVFAIRMTLQLQAEHFLIDSLGVYDISPEMIERRIGHPLTEEITEQEQKLLKRWIKDVQRRRAGGPPTDRLDGKERKRFGQAPLVPAVPSGVPQFPQPTRPYLTGS